MAFHAAKKKARKSVNKAHQNSRKRKAKGIVPSTSRFEILKNK